MKIFAFLLSLIVSSAIQNAFAQGTVLWDESINGQFSESSGAPTALSPLQLGTNTIIGSTEIEPSGGIWIAHPDFFTLQVPNGLVVNAVYLQVNKPNVWTWIGEPTFVNALGFVPNPASGELLSQLGLGSISSGTYGMYMSNHDLESSISVANYRLDFFVQAVPEPGAVSLLLVGAGVVGFLRWKKFR